MEGLISVASAYSASLSSRSATMASGISLATLSPRELQLRFKHQMDLTMVDRKGQGIRPSEVAVKRAIIGNVSRRPGATIMNVSKRVGLLPCQL
ncbi:hypothetical protein BJX96DRAFT_139022 [Aspergillus floccosus]